MIETYVDFASSEDIREATDDANLVIKRNENAGWNLIQSQLIQSCDEEDKFPKFIYSMVFQRTKEIKARQQFEFGGEHAFKEQSSGEISLGDESKTSEEV